MRKPPDRSNVTADTGRRRPDYVIETWVSEQLRDRIERHGASLAEVLRQTDPQGREPDAELEAEP
jgi:hypothetical protein